MNTIEKLAHHLKEFAKSARALAADDEADLMPTTSGTPKPLAPGDTINNETSQTAAQLLDDLPEGSSVTDNSGTVWNRKTFKPKQELVWMLPGNDKYGARSIGIADHQPITIDRIGPTEEEGSGSRVPKVGDTVTTEAEYAALPEGSIVARNGDATAIGKFKSGQWGAGMDYRCDRIDAVPRTVLRVGWEA